MFILQIIYQSVNNKTLQLRIGFTLPVTTGIIPSLPLWWALGLHDDQHLSFTLTMSDTHFTDRVSLEKLSRGALNGSCLSQSLLACSTIFNMLFSSHGPM